MLELINLSKRFGDTPVVRSINLSVRSGEVMTLLGPSGCGKTTTLRMIAGLEMPDEGDIVFDGRKIVSIANNVFLAPHKRTVGMVFQSYAIWPHMTVFENVAYPLAVQRMPREQIRTKVRSILELVELAGLENRQAPQLSGGQQQRVAVARALVAEPKALLLDEPFSNLDARLREQTRGELKRLLSQLQITTIFVTHDQEEALSMSHRIAVMAEGRIEQVGTPREVYERPSTPMVRDFLGRMVLLHGVIFDSESQDRVHVRLRGAPDVPLMGVQIGSEISLRTGDEVLTAIRPEDIEIRNSGERNSSSIVGEVTSLAFLGDHYECRIALLAGESVIIPVHPSFAIRNCDEVCLKIRDEAISVWPA